MGAGPLSPGPHVLGGRYELRGVLGVGGMAEVRDGWDTRLGRPVAVKLLHPALGVRPDARARFEEEARSAARLSHPNIVAVHDYGHHGGTPYIVMERLPGTTLHDEIGRGPLPSMRVRAILDEMLAALSVAHAAGVVHRDIKPANVLTAGPGGTVKVADFGIAKTDDGGHTKTGQLVGTMAYTSPERLAGAPSSVADDLYAVGVVGYELAARRSPFPQNDPAALAFAIMNGSHPPLAAVVDGVDPVLSAVIDRALAHDPRARFASADEMRAALAGPRPGTRVYTAPFAPVVSNAHPRPVPVTRSRWTRRRTALAAVGVLAAVIVTALALALSPTSQNSPAPASTTTSSSPPPVSSSPPPVPSTTVAQIEEPAPPPGPPPGKGKGPKHRD
ncbi:serine/threonine protein kinase [Mycobacterium yunnanensis]|uniref:non-specific serine/threonine protein kinase n=1 Tax=Mycobacterium yunnanensis TaxID=368477 RepID=A0A9X2Z1Z6_9MYCO|nr:serine/threonine-protein kinase [Mycobacterium yunnanensis]MCV7422148.1 serine/threonine protein kinase [Mycobacterium yunnanensis]